MKKYAKLIWEHVACFTMLDFLTVFFLISILYLATELFCMLTRIKDPYRDFAIQSIKLLVLIYIGSIFITACWNHIMLLRQFVKSETKGDTSPQDIETNSTSDTPAEGESKC